MQKDYDWYEFKEHIVLLYLSFLIYFYINCPQGLRSMVKV